MLRRLLAIFALLGTISPALGASTASNDLEACRAAAVHGGIDFKNAFEVGLRMGIVEATMTNLPLRAVPTCLPQGVTTGQALKVLVKYMDDHPEQLHEKTAWVAAKALHEAWPCAR
jgi:hypothetical protein